MTRAKFGDRRACKLCEMDIEFLGKPSRRVLVPGGRLSNSEKPAEDLTIVEGGWTGRGGDRFCDESGAARYDDSGTRVSFPHRLHRP